MGGNGRDRGLLSCCWCPPFSPFGAAHLGAAKFLYRPETPDCFCPIRSTCEPEGDFCCAASPVAGWPRSWGRSPARAPEMRCRPAPASSRRSQTSALCGVAESTAGVHLADLRSRSPGSEPRTLGTRTDRRALFQAGLFPCSISNGNHPRSLGPLGPSRCLTSALGARRVATRPTAREISASVGSRRGGRGRHHGRRAPLAVSFY